jgi:hypothetical protein
MKLDLRFIRLRLRRQPGRHRESLRLRGHQQQLPRPALEMEGLRHRPPNPLPHEGQQVRPRMRRRSHPLSPNPSPPLLISPSSMKSTFVHKTCYVHPRAALSVC